MKNNLDSFEIKLMLDDYIYCLEEYSKSNYTKSCDQYYESREFVLRVCAIIKVMLSTLISFYRAIRKYESKFGWVNSADRDRLLNFYIDQEYQEREAR